MSVPEGARGGNRRFSLEVKAEELASYTLKITANEKIFLPEHQRALTDDIIMQAKNIYLFISEANDIRVVKESPDFLRDRRERRRLQNEAVKSTTRLLKLIDLAHRVFHLSRKRVKYWGQMVISIRDRTKHWAQSDMKRFSDEEQ
jgi:hypothetical protein